jgi:hypothetical protein
VSEDPPGCGVCGAPALYQFGEHLRCLRHAILYDRVLTRSLLLGAVVGTTLVTINQFDVVMSGHLNPLVAAKVLLTYSVPFGVSTYTALASNRRRH